MLKPLKDKIVIKELESEEKTAGGLIVPDMAKDRPVKGEVVAVGTGIVTADGSKVLPEVSVGDIVLFEKMNSNEVKVEDEDYIIIAENSILGVL